ncbi:MAG: transposase, partial [Betaproteobacteria bacterium]|nr:transposase [Betaproteobacteria bacterium]
VQLVQDGIAPTKYEFLSSGQTVGLDVGPSTIAVVGDEGVGLEQFASGVVQPWNHQRRLQRALDRSRRATNPDNYNRNGTAKKGRHTWIRSKHYLDLQRQIAEVERQLAATRKKEHGTVANQILGLGNLIQTETLSYKAFQKNYGRSVKVRAPGMFIERLTRKAESAGGTLVELNTRRLRMSPYDHVSGTYAKKPLSQRWHRLGGDDVIVQRDCYSAFLARNAMEDGHSSSRLEEGWAVAEPLLERAGLCRHHQSTSGLPKGNPTAAMPSESIARKKRFVRGLHRDAVGINPESPDAPRMHAFRTPWL